MLTFGNSNVLQSHLNQALLEEKQLGAPTRKTLLGIACLFVRCAPSWYSGSGDPHYSEQEKAEAKALLLKYGFKKYCNLSPCYKKVTLALIMAELAKEA